ncbi:uncharacterized protein TNCV_323141 [Trichonephila clavipes]|nr:uncharacterized protein TNCV_323141 [Trichonephila clavipes]
MIPVWDQFELSEMAWFVVFSRSPPYPSMIFNYAQMETKFVCEQQSVPFGGPDFAFVRGHTGVLGNERADWLAKAATKRKIDIDVNIPKSFYKKITNERMMKSWNQEYLISNKGSITKKFFPTINKRLSCHHFYTNYKLTQFLTGHGNFKSYLNKFNLAPSSFCDCNIGGEENVEHVIFCVPSMSERERS